MNGFCLELRHPKEGHFNDLSQHRPPLSAQRTKSVAQHLSCSWVQTRSRGECKACCTGGVVTFSGARVETANYKGKLFIMLKAVHSNHSKVVNSRLLTLKSATRQVMTSLQNEWNPCISYCYFPKSRKVNGISLCEHWQVPIINPTRGSLHLSKVV
jgi:hypothetical protein